MIKRYVLKLVHYQIASKNILPEVSIKWSQKPFTVLGITYCIDLNPIAMHELNFLPKLCEMKKNLLLLGETSVESSRKNNCYKLYYFAKNYPLNYSSSKSPVFLYEGVKTTFFNFLWNNKPPKVAKNVLHKTMRMVDFE